MADAMKKRPVKYKFGVLIPNDYRHAVEIDNENRNNEWQDANGTEVGKLQQYKTFIDWGKRPPPAGFKRITVHMVYDCKYDGRKRARLVAGGTRLNLQGTHLSVELHP